MKQKLITPPIMDCICMSKARLIDWEFRDRWRVMCDKNHTFTGEFNTRHRAVCRWNNEVSRRVKDEEEK
jgi:hypothetical protein